MGTQDRGEQLGRDWLSDRVRSPAFAIGVPRRVRVERTGTATVCRKTAAGSRLPRSRPSFGACWRAIQHEGDMGVGRLSTNVGHVLR